MALDQKRRRHASISIDSLFVVTVRIGWYVSVYRSFSERHNSLLRVGFKSLQCADVCYIRQYTHDDVGSFSSMCEEAFTLLNDCAIKFRTHRLEMCTQGH